MSFVFREGAHVVDADGTGLGDVERLVIDPSRATVTHLVIAKGFFFPDERVVPVELVTAADDERVELRGDIELDDLDAFESTHYLPADEHGVGGVAPEAAVGSPVIWGYPFVAGLGAYPAYPAYGVDPGTTATVRHVPEGSSVVEGGSQVVAADGTDVGKVREATVDERGALVSIDVDPGWFRSAQTVPAHLIASIGEDEIVLAVGPKTLEHLDRRGD